jgi:hypothetical protein
MDALWTKTLPALARLSTRELRQRYQALFGELATANNRIWMMRRIAWRLQAKALGGLTDRAISRAQELVSEADLRLNPPSLRKKRSPGHPRRQIPEQQTGVDRRLPTPGTIVTRNYKGTTVKIKILTQGIEYEGTVFQSLSAVAKAVTGSHCNGYQFFKLGAHGGAS